MPCVDQVLWENTTGVCVDILFSYQTTTNCQGAAAVCTRGTKTLLLAQALALIEVEPVQSTKLHFQ